MRSTTPLAVNQQAFRLVADGWRPEDVAFAFEIPVARTRRWRRNPPATTVRGSDTTTTTPYKTKGRFLLPRVAGGGDAHRAWLQDCDAPVAVRNLAQSWPLNLTVDDDYGGEVRPCLEASEVADGRMQPLTPDEMLRWRATLTRGWIAA